MRHLEAVAFVLLLAGGCASAPPAVELRPGLWSSSGGGFSGIRPTVTVEVAAKNWGRGQLWRASAQVRGANKVDGGSGYVAAVDGHLVWPVGRALVGIGYRLARLEVDDYAIDAGAPVLSYSSPARTWRFELSQDDTERQTQILNVLFRWRRLWWQASYFRFGDLGSGPDRDGTSFSAGYRWKV